jgi:translation initiation factor IF-1
MAKEGEVVIAATVKEALPNAQFRVQLDEEQGGHVILAYVSGRMRMHFIKILPGDRVTLSLSSYDLTKGRIIYRGDVTQNKD